MRYVKTVVKASGAVSAVATIVDVMNAIHATPVNTRCTFNVHVMPRSCRACSASRTRIDPCTENTRLGSNGGSMLNYFDPVSLEHATLTTYLYNKRFRKPKRSEIGSFSQIKTRITHFKLTMMCVFDSYL